MQTAGALGIMGGSGLYQMEGMEVEDEIGVRTPFGAPSDRYVAGKLAGRPVVFLARHGRAHTIMPGGVNYRANVYGFKKLGVERLVAVSAVGSMREEIRPLHIVLPDQFIDRTRGRADTFFGDGVVAHIAFARPVCPQLHAALRDAGQSCGATVWPEGTYLCIEGPAFSTRAESQLYRSWGVTVIGMTNLPEAKLAREAEMCYATLALVTDFDCWHETQEEVSVEMLLENLRRNAGAAQELLRALVTALAPERSCPCQHALRDALVTAPDQIAPEAKNRLDIVIGRYLQ
ncbi:MAG: S-methyl-5'-thioadenosine phosphorylase [Candidatus Brocadiae bacterium]|nr:S-methyl-5'-thioadenosine phosphorylase [Candidatus Brocadiia bacterium]